jgi:AraC-like DNA-binding protein
MHRGAKHGRGAGAVGQASKVVEQPSPVDDARGPMGIRLAPLVEGASLPLAPNLPSLVAPTGAGVDELRVGPTRHTFDRASFALLAPGVRATVEAKSPVSHILVLTIGDALAARLVAAYKGEIDPHRLDVHLHTTQLLPRTNWVNEVFHRYLFERAVCRRRDNDATRFLETELVKELYFLCEARAGERDRASVAEGQSPLVQRALDAIEERLFEPDVVQRLPRTCGASASTLLRAFKRELASSPIEYVRKRRLDESLLLLKSRRFIVSEVATLVGYRNFAAFSQAFRARFGVRPSEVRPPSR